MDIGFVTFVSKGEEEVEQVPAETLYQGLLPSLPQYMVSALCLGLLLGHEIPHRLVSFMPTRLLSPWHLQEFPSQGFILVLASDAHLSALLFPDCPTEDPTGCSSHIKSQNRLNQHPGRCSA